MIVQLFKALVEAVNEQKESFRIRNMDRHGNTQRPARFPHGIKTLVIYFHERPPGDLVAQIQSERLQDFQSTNSGFVSADNFIRLKLAVSRLIRTFPPGFRKSYKAVRMWCLIFSNRLFQTFSNSTCEVHHDTDVLTVHQRQ